MKEILNFIGGEFQAGISREWIETSNPATEEVLAKVVNSNNQDAMLAIESAHNAFEEWSHTSIGKRSKILSKMADIIEKRVDELATWETKDNGKPISLTKYVDIPRAATNLRFFSQAITQNKDFSFNSPGSMNIAHRSPLGVVSAISPWNLPLYLFTWKIAPAIATGNCVVGKPSEVTPITASILAEVAHEAGLPKGVLNIIHGQGHRMGETLVTDPTVKAISFTGSTQTGRTIARLASEHFKKVSLEMGGKNPTIIFADCDYEKALETTLKAAFTNQGQICLCGSRILIEESIYQKFKNDLVAKTKSLLQGDPLDPHTQQGALVSKQHFEKVIQCIELAKSEGGRILCGGERLGSTGYFITPAIIEGLCATSKTNQEEIFGPVATITPFKDEEEALKLANNCRYGLSTSLWTTNHKRALAMSTKIEAGIIWVNTWMNRDLRTPFGGHKESGVGREGGQYALDFFTEVKNICFEY